MNKKSTNEEGFFKSKGFYYSLYACIGLVLILTVVVSYNNINSTNPNKQNDNASKKQSDLANAGSNLVSDSDLQAVLRNDSGSYLTPDDLANSSKNSPIPGKETTPKSGTDKPATTNPESSQTTPSPNPSNPAAPNLPNPGNQTPSSSNDTESGKTGTVQTDGAENENSLATGTVISDGDLTLNSEDESSVELADVLAESIFAGYNESDKMSWPVNGEIVMDFSPDKLVLDTTLEQFRVNKSISIAAPKGSQVKAAADGIVLSVGNSREDGNYAVLDNGNGWKTTYSQLQDSVLVKVGDYVKEGQVIGGVNSPSYYSILLGDHLTVSVTKDDVAYDPKLLFE